MRFRYGALIKLTDEYRKIIENEIAKEHVKKPKFYKGFLSNESFVYLGEVAQMSGHIICAGVLDGKIYVGFHDDDFRELTDDEV